MNSLRAPGAPRQPPSPELGARSSKPSPLRAGSELVLGWFRAGSPFQGLLSFKHNGPEEREGLGQSPSSHRNILCTPSATDSWPGTVRAAVQAEASPEDAVGDRKVWSM